MTNVERRFTTAMREADSDDPGLIQEDDGTVWLVDPDGTRTQLPGTGGGLPAGGSTGEVLTKASNADGDADWEAGGGSQPDVQEAEYGAGASINLAPNTFGQADWSPNLAQVGNNCELDLTDPTNPVVTVAGYYSMTGYVTVPAAQAEAGKHIWVSAQADSDDFVPGMIIAVELIDSGVGIPFIYVPIAFSWYMAVGMKVLCYVKHNATASLTDVQMSAYLTRTTGLTGTAPV